MISPVPALSQVSSSLQPTSTPMIKRKKNLWIKYIKDEMKEAFTREEMAEGGTTERTTLYKGRRITTKALDHVKLKIILKNAREKFPEKRKM